MSLSRAIVTSRCQVPLNLSTDGARVYSYDPVSYTHLDVYKRQGIEKIKALRKVFWSDLHLPGKVDDLNIELEKALRLADFLEIGELMAHDALDREESCGGHFRIEHQTEEGEAKRDDENFAYVSCWEYQGEGQDPVMHKEPLVYEFTERLQRNYKN